MTIYLPDETLLVGDVLNDVSWSTRTPPDLAAKLPRRAVYALGGTTVHPKFMGKPLVHVSSYASTYDAARTLAWTGHNALFNAWQTQHRYTHGVIHRIVEVAAPFEPRTGTEPDGVFRFDATYQVFTRP